MLDLTINKYIGKNNNVFKYVFENKDHIIESVLYRYPTFKKRTVICCSTQSGCPVGCLFCGTGNKFIRNLLPNEILYQISHILNNNQIEANKIEKFQIMFMSMGEPLLNFNNIEKALNILNIKYPKAELLISTIAPRTNKWKALFKISKKIKQIGLQFSIHETTDYKRNKIIPFKDKLSLKEISKIGTLWHNKTGRNPYCNYCANKNNIGDENIKQIKELFDPIIFKFTVSVISNKIKGNPTINFTKRFYDKLISANYDVRIFNPAGQDDIGAGCGQLWKVQKWYKDHQL